MQGKLQLLTTSLHKRDNEMTSYNTQLEEKSQEMAEMTTKLEQKTKEIKKLELESMYRLFPSEFFQ